MESNQDPLAAKRSRKVKKEALQDSSKLTVMDEQVWKELPEDLLKGVIARLPITAFIRFRSVCREWNSLHKSQSFLQRWEEVGSPQNKPWLYSITYGQRGRDDTRAMYDPCAKKWRFCSAESTLTPALYPVASFGGLICCVDPGKQCFIVGNPITQTWKELSYSPNVGIHLGSTTICLGMVTNNPALSSRGYKIVMVGSWGGYEVYEYSVINNSTITTTGLIPEIITLMKSPRPFHRYACSVTIDTVVYFLISNPSGLLSFDAVSGGWKVFHIPPPPNSTDLSLAECGGRILLTGLVRDKDEYERGTIVSVCVWKLQRTMLAWTEVDRMPKSWCSDSGCKEAYLMCVGNKGVLMMMLQKTQMNRVFTYDVVNREWSKAPRYVLPGRGWLLYTDGGIAFFPSLSAAP